MKARNERAVELVALGRMSVSGTDSDLGEMLETLGRRSLLSLLIVCGPITMNLDRYRKDIEDLVAEGTTLLMAMQAECFPEEFDKQISAKLEGKQKGKKAAEIRKNLPNFTSSYQGWYSKAKATVRQLLPDRLDDFVRLYEKPRSRKDITYENYRIEDYLQGLTITKGWEKIPVVGPDAALPIFSQQLGIVKALGDRLESSLYDIQHIVQADLFDSELEAATALLKAGHIRAAGVVAGVVLERHLSQVADNHKVAMRKKHPGIADWNDALKAADVIGVPQWRTIQHLGDIRNLCGHNKEREPSRDEVEGAIAGVTRIVKTLF